MSLFPHGEPLPWASSVLESLAVAPQDRRHTVHQPRPAGASPGSQLPPDSSIYSLPPAGPLYSPPPAPSRQSSIEFDHQWPTHAHAPRYPLDPNFGPPSSSDAPYLHHADTSYSTYNWDQPGWAGPDSATNEPTPLPSTTLVFPAASPAPLHPHPPSPNPSTAPASTSTTNAAITAPLPTQQPDTDDDDVPGASKPSRKRRRRLTEVPRDIARRKHGCEKCGKRFARPSALTTHMFVHTKVRPHPCPFEGCGDAFSVAANLRRHQKIYDHYPPS